jgi:hypothetical protein
MKTIARNRGCAIANIFKMATSCIEYNDSIDGHRDVSPHYAAAEYSKNDFAKIIRTGKITFDVVIHSGKIFKVISWGLKVNENLTS